jgi:hypothetical protein
MKFEVDTDTILEKVKNQMMLNVEKNAQAQGLSEEEVLATMVLNKKKIAQDAQGLAVFFTGIYVEAPAETVAEEGLVESFE